MSATIHVINLREFIHAVDVTHQDTRKFVRELLKDAAFYGEKQVKDKMTSAHGVDTSDSRRGIHSEFGETVNGDFARIIPGNDTTIFLEVDTAPHWPPPGALEAWARRHGIAEFIVQRKIAESGTQGLYMFERSVPEIRTRVGREMKNLAKRIGAAWDNG